MNITVRVIVDPGDGQPAVSHDVAVLAREELTVTTAGLRLHEAHQVLTGIQEHLVTAQAGAALDRAATCGDCGRRLAHKDCRTIVLRSLFGTLHLASPRFKTCTCRTGAAGTVSPLAEILPERTTPELAYWEAKYAALASYGGAAELLTDTFPLGRTLQAGALRRRTTRTAGRLEADLGDERASFIDTCPRDWETLPRPDLPLVVGLDGGYVHSKAQTSRRDGWFEVIAGRSIPTGDGKSKCFAYTQTYDTKPRRRLYELLKSQGMQDNQTVEFSTDGGEDVRELPYLLNPARMVKKQQMRWTPQGAHLLLQLRTRVLNDDLADDFNRWYPGFTVTDTSSLTPQPAETPSPPTPQTCQGITSRLIDTPRPSPPPRKVAVSVE